MEVFVNQHSPSSKLRPPNPLTLPHALIHRFHCYLNLQEITNCSYANVCWSQLLKDGRFWKQLFNAWYPMATDEEGIPLMTMPIPSPIPAYYWKTLCFRTYLKRSNLFKGKSVSSTGLRRFDKDEVCRLVTCLGGSYCADFSRQVNYLVAATYRSDKYRLAIRIGTPIVKLEWLLESTVRICIQPHLDYRPSFDPPIICGTGFNVKDREYLREEVLRLGGKYSNALTKTCTHLLARPSNDGRKLAAAQRWGVTVCELRESDDLRLIIKQCFPHIFNTRFHKLSALSRPANSSYSSIIEW